MRQDSNIHLHGFLIWLIGALFFMYEFFLRTFVGSVAYQVIPDLHLNAETFSIIGASYYIAYALMQIPVGVLADKFGVKLSLAFATLLCAVATFIFAHASEFVVAFIGRVLMGVGSAFAFVCLLIIVINWFPRKYFGTFSGVSQFVGTMGPLLGGGPLIAVMQTYHESWRTALSGVAIVGLVLCALVILVVKNKPRNAKQKLVFLQKEKPFKERLSILIKNKQVWCIALFSATTYTSIALLGAIWGTEYLQARGLSQYNAANMISLSWFGYAVGCPLTGVISDAMRRRKPVMITTTIIGMIVTSLLVFMPLGHSLYRYGFLFFSLGIAASGQNISFAIMSEQVDRLTRATAIGLNNGGMMITSAFIPPIVSYFIYRISHGSAQLTAHDFTAPFTIMPILYALSCFAAVFLIRETYCKPQKDKIVLKIHYAD